MIEIGALRWCFNGCRLMREIAIPLILLPIYNLARTVLYKDRSIDTASV